MIEDDLYDKVCMLEESSQTLSLEDNRLIEVYLNLYESWLISDSFNLSGSDIFKKVEKLVGVSLFEGLE